MSDSWEPWGDQRQRAGEYYRIRLMVRAPYTAATTAALKTGFQIHAAVTGLRDLSFYHAPPLYDPRANGIGAFPFIVKYQVDPRSNNQEIQTAGLDPKAVYALAVLVVAGLLAFAIASHHIDRLVTTVGENVKGVVTTAGGQARDLAHEVLNPGLILLAFVLGAIIITKGGH